MNNKKFICPVCGFEGLEEKPYDDFGENSCQKCVCCEFTSDIFKKFPNFQYSKELNLPYIIAGDFVDYMQALVNTDKKELKNCLNYIEGLFLSKQPYIKELATIGFIEGIQNSWSDENKKLIYRKLGKKSKKAWKDLNKFWEGK